MVKIMTMIKDDESFSDSLLIISKLAFVDFLSFWGVCLQLL